MDATASLREPDETSIAPFDGLRESRFAASLTCCAGLGDFGRSGPFALRAPPLPADVDGVCDPLIAFALLCTPFCDGFCAGCLPVAVEVALAVAGGDPV